MPSFCAVINCGSSADRDGDHIRFFRIPSIMGRNRKVCDLSKERQDAWLKAIHRSDMTESKIKYGRVCSRHFLSGQPAELSDTANPDWVPSKDMGYHT